METALEIIRELTKDEAVMWVVGRGDVVSENDSKGIKEPEVGLGHFLYLQYVQAAELV